MIMGPMGGGINRETEYTPRERNRRCRFLWIAAWEISNIFGYAYRVKLRESGLTCTYGGDTLRFTCAPPSTAPPGWEGCLIVSSN